ncbi:unnamed protein product [Effrenium voratum]|nr:unnamed protein product [Effrenium voratum]
MQEVSSTAAPSIDKSVDILVPSCLHEPQKLKSQCFKLALPASEPQARQSRHFRANRIERAGLRRMLGVGRLAEGTEVMAASALLQKKTFVTVQEEVAHNRLIQNKWYPGGQPAAAIEGEDEVRFMGGDAYVPRLVAANVPIAKPAAAPMGPAPGPTSYAEPLQAQLDKKREI